MRLAMFRHGGRQTVGLVDPAAGLVWPVDGLVPGGEAPADLLDLIRRNPAGAPSMEPAGVGVPLAEVKLEAPIPQPRRNIMCVGKNYHAHAQEFTRSGFDSSASAPADAIPKAPIIFTKASNTVVADGAPIPLHPGLDSHVDYEAELAVIIGVGGRNISREDAWKHVWGYTIVNDVTARDLQAKHKQWFIGKSQDGFCPMGPWVVTADEVDATNLMVRCWVNGELRQNANTRDLIFDIPCLIETLSAGITLEPGDIIATGTPEGVGIGFDPPRYLKDGDEVTIEIEGLGRISNPVRRAGATTHRPAPAVTGGGPVAASQTKREKPWMETINGKSLTVESCGSGPNLIMIHGLGGTANTWLPQILLLKDRFSLVVPDMEGAGRSPCQGDISIASMVQDVLALMSARGIEKAHFAGHSMGTIVCQHLAALHPEKVSSLALMGALPEPPPPARPALKDRAAKARSEGMAGIADAIVTAGTSADTKANNPAAAAFVRESILRQDPEGYARNCEALSAAKAADAGRIQAPTLLLTGDEDKTAPPAVMEGLRSAIHGAQGQVVPGCGHWITIERAKQVNYAMNRFYNELAG